MKLQPTFDHDECRRLYDTGRYTQAALARMFNVTPQRIWQVVNPAHPSIREHRRRWYERHHKSKGEPCSKCGAPRPLPVGTRQVKTSLCKSCLSAQLVRHGIKRYQAGCRCEKCRAASAAQKRRQRARHREHYRAYDRQRRQRAA